MKKIVLSIIITLCLIICSLTISYAEESATPDNSALEERISTLEEENETIKATLNEIMSILESAGIMAPEDNNETIDSNSDNNSIEGLLLYDDGNISISFLMCEEWNENRGYRKSKYPYNVVFTVENRTDYLFEFYC